MSTEHGQQQPSGSRRGRGSGDKKPRKHSRRKETYSMYIYKVLKQVRVERAPTWGRCCSESGLGGILARWRVASHMPQSYLVSEVPTP